MLKVSPSISSRFAAFCADTRLEHFPGPVVSQAKKVLLDTVGVALAGLWTMEFPRLLVEYLTGLGGKEEATIIGKPGKFPATNAAMANAASAHAIDMDDGHRFGALHPGTVVIPAALSAAEMSGASSLDLLTGIVCGYEIMIRVGMAINPSSLRRGHHATGVTGVFGAVAAAAKILGLTEDQMVAAFGLAGLQGSGILQVNHDSRGAAVKPINPAKAAQSGLLSAILAQKGAVGPLRIFEGEEGFLQAMTDEAHEDRLVDGLGSRWEILNVYFKLYAACRHAHAAIDAARDAFASGKLTPEQIDKVEVETYSAVARLAGIAEPDTTSAARFSTQFSVALALCSGDAGSDKYTETRLRDPRIRELSRKVALQVSPEWEERYPRQRGATVRIFDRYGGCHVSRVELARGEPENPAPWEEIQAKFRDNACMVLDEENVRALEEVVGNLESAPLSNFSALLTVLRATA